MIGIYKITSPSKRIYVGSTTNIKKRWSAYRRLECKSQSILYKSLLKYGVNKHIFEVITECDVNNMFQLETHWGLFYNVLDKKAGLNSLLPKDGDIYGGCSNETKQKISNIKKGITAWNKGVKTGIVTHNARLILDFNTGVYYYSSVDASNYTGIKRTTINNMLNGKSKNKTPLRYV